MANLENETYAPDRTSIEGVQVEVLGGEGPITLEFDGPTTSPPIIVTEEPAEELTDPPLPTPALAAPDSSTPTATDFSSPQRSPFAQDGHHGADRRETRTPQQSRDRTDSQSTTATASTQQTKSSLVFVVTSLETIAASKEARKNKKLTESLQRALTAIKGDGDPAHQSPEVLFEPLQLATELSTVQVVTTALDCIGKLISYSYFSIPAESQTEPSDGPPLIERAIDTICDCFQSEATPVETQLQIVKSLLAAILNDKIVVHGAGLLKAVRLTYNIFLLSKSTPNQMLAQTALTQMVGTVFERVKTRLELKEARINSSKTSLEKEEEEMGESSEIDTSLTAIDGSALNGGADGSESSEVASTAPSDVPVEKRDTPKITLQSFENRKSFDDARITESAPTLVTRVKDRPKSKRLNSTNSTGVNGGAEANGDSTYEDEEDEIFIRDAYLVFRAMCRLSTKSLSVEHALDVKSQGMRSKLLSLHIIYSLLNNNTAVFISPYATIRSSNNDEPTSFVQAVKQYLCLSLSRNGVSSVRPVFEVSCEIFWIMLKFLRVMMKKEIEVFLKEIYLSILDKRAAPAWQKQMILVILSRMAADPRALVEVYLNYDCDRTALDNMFERIIEHLSRISSTPVNATAMQQQAFQEQHAKSAGSSASEWQHRIVLPSLGTASIQTPTDSEQGFPAEYAMKHEALEALVEILRSLVHWSQQGIADIAYNLNGSDFRKSADGSRESLDKASIIVGASPHIGATDSPGGFATPIAEDDPNQFDREKQRKTAMANATRQFNFKPKRGIKTLIKEGFIQSDNPQDIARFFLANDQINKATLGEYLGEGEPENIAIMHAFVDQMEFRQTRFVDALRRFLQSFRLPGEAQKIDRFMLKFAERYITGNPKAFANADTAYVLAYSVVMLNTDQHSSNVKKRMTPEDFIKNNRGINDNADLPDEYLTSIYEEIRANEIILNSERETAANLGMLTQQPSSGIAATIGQAVANASRDLKKEEYAQTEEIANRTEQLYKSLLRAQRRGASKVQPTKFVPASSFKHAGPMFQVAWMSFLTALTGAAQNTQNLEVVKLCMEGQKLAIRIACLFDLDDPRQAFVASLSRFTNLYNLSEMKAKNMEALKALLDVANLEGNLLRDSWRDILTCISQLDRFQLISTGVDEGAVPDGFTPHKQGQRPQPVTRRTLNVPKGHRPRMQSGNVSFQADIAEESRSADIVRSVDRIFTNTAKMSGDGILHFVRALTQVSWQEIQSSGQSDSPRTYSLQKIVEISGYNMTRVRFEWASIWQVLGQHFNQVGCHTNTNVVFFALDSLRQLSMRFMEIEELPGFKFQKDFLKPFEHIIGNSSVVPVKDMVLRCLIQMIQARGANIRSGWRTMFGVFTVAAREPYEGIVNLAYDNVLQIYNKYFGVVITQGAFADLIVCLTEFSKNMKFQKKSLQAIEMLKSTVPKMLRTPECPLSATARKGEVLEGKSTDAPKQPSQQTQEEQYWFPVLFAFHDVLMTGDDLEVRSRALNYLFETLMRYGDNFPPDFWDTLWRQLLYPIFMVLRSKSEMSKFATNEELSVWLSTTMIQALRNMITLFTHFFESLEYMLDRFLDLLILCICQENDTLARIGSNCLQQLILQNVAKFTPDHWHKIVGAFVELFARTEATALFSAATSSSFTPKLVTNGFDRPRSGSASDEASLSELSLSATTSEPDVPNADNALGINGVPSASARPRVYTNPEPDTPTTPRAISAASQPQDLEDYRPDPDSQQTPVVVTAARRRFFNQIITKCVLTLLMIETVNELFSNDTVYAQIPSTELLRLMGLLKKSYHFAKRFNGDRDLRTRLFKEGFMKQPPNLLKQESGAASVYVSILIRMYHDNGPERLASRSQTEAALVPLCIDIVQSYVDLDEETQQRNIVTWRPVVVDVLEGYTNFPDEEFGRHVKVFAPLVVGLMGREMGGELQRVMQGLLGRIFEREFGVEIPGGLVTPVSERGGFGFGSRRGSRAR
ncbi:guanyl-nucleotide exchange factor [Tothia fuscella]|uniref:Guanyl-nucleotide exchange factor n=1 Tax=Tothia fuscella TaxID=1048955 RepID=A0A9P4P1D4_9PEZI|nr:guanyl-nucleotide exchange factor [Tothia fuscella]